MPSKSGRPRRQSAFALTEMRATDITSTSVRAKASEMESVAASKQATQSKPSTDSKSQSDSGTSARAGLKGSSYDEQVKALAPADNKQAGEKGGAPPAAIPDNKKRLYGLANSRVNKMVPVSVTNAIGLNIGGYRNLISLGFERAANFQEAMAQPSAVDGAWNVIDSLEYRLGTLINNIRCTTRKVHEKEGRAPTRGDLTAHGWSTLVGGFERMLGHKVNLLAFTSIWDPTMLGVFGEDEWGEIDL